MSNSADDEWEKIEQQFGADATVRFNIAMHRIFSLIVTHFFINFRVYRILQLITMVTKKVEDFGILHRETILVHRRKISILRC
jgi:hypothetical protein